MNQLEANMREQARFPLAFKRARLAKQLKQETLAAQLHVKLRTLASWETGRGCVAKIREKRDVREVPPLVELRLPLQTGQT